MNKLTRFWPKVRFGVRIVGAVLLTVALASSVKPSTASATPVYYLYQNLYSGLCLTAASTAITQNTCQVSPRVNNQQWTEVAVGDGYYQVKLKSNPSNCLTDPGTPTDNTQLTQTACVSGHWTQEWQSRADVGVNFKVSYHNHNTGKCMDDQAFSKTSGTKIIGYPCFTPAYPDHLNQAWGLL